MTLAQKLDSIAQTLELAEKDLLRLQDAQAKNATELSNLKETKNKLESELMEANSELEKLIQGDQAIVDVSQRPKLEQQKEYIQQTILNKNNEIEINKIKTQSAIRHKTMLSGQISRKNQQIATLIEAFGEAAKATITSNASSSAMFEDNGTTSNLLHSTTVANAVRAITLNAINQDYEVQGLL